MSKGEAVELLKKNEFEASVEDGIVMVSLVVKNSRELIKKEKEICNLLDDCGYTGSLGWRARFEK